MQLRWKDSNFRKKLYQSTAVIAVLGVLLASVPLLLGGESQRVALTAADHAAIAKAQQAEQAQLAADAARIEAERIAAEQAAAQKAAADAAALKARLAAAAKAKAARAARTPRSVPAFSGDLSNLVDRLAMCESGMNPRTNTGNGFYGAFQFMLRTWNRFRPGNPIDYSYAEQKAVIMQYFPVSSWRTQFPACARKLGVA